MIKNSFNPDQLTTPILSTNHGSYFSGRRNRMLLQAMPNGLLYAVKKRHGELMYLLHNANRNVPIRHNIDKNFSGMHELLCRFLPLGNSSDTLTNCADAEFTYTTELGFCTEYTGDFPGLIVLCPQKDRVLATGRNNLTAQISSDGTPYIIHGEHMVLCDAIPLRIAFGCMERTQDGSTYQIKESLTALDQPYFTISVNELPFHIHVSNTSLKETFDSLPGMHASPIAFRFIDTAEVIFTEIDFERTTILFHESEA